MDQVFAVLTGDFIGSRKAGSAALDLAFTRLEETAETLTGWHGSSVRLTRFRGDGWQMLLARPPLVLRSALLIHAALRRDDLTPTRIAIGIGGVLRAGDTDLSDAEGPAFERAGQTLDTMARGRHLSLCADGVPPLAPAMTRLMDALADGWTATQAQTVALALAPDAPPQSIIAARDGVTQQAVADRLVNASFAAIEEALERFEEAMMENKPEDL